jgi:hypothetical protein
MSLVKVTNYIKRKWTGETYKGLEWAETGVLQLHRMACEGRGIGPWSGEKSDVPMTKDTGLTFSLTKLSLLHMFARSEDSVGEKDEEDEYPGMENGF